MYGGDKKYSGVRKNCPEYILPHWDKFLATVKNYFDENSRLKSPARMIRSTEFSLEHIRIRKTPKARLGSWRRRDIRYILLLRNSYSVHILLLGSAKLIRFPP